MGYALVPDDRGRVARKLSQPHFAGANSGAIMHKAGLGTLLAVALVGMSVQAAGAQQPATPAPEVGPKVGEMAPDFEFTGITRYGKLANSQKLSDLRGQTVVLAFFTRARTRG
jgi:hypothetical protein